ncbi:nicotinamide mononucleotide transporter family protein [Cardinium endosymbiont of Tipula unca]|uniref:nicotinamide mononucleotide transporter family protein n=1 Tax=Cardinium endosymbiont of Tipula unca TaxID=3066216 RepID=UPI0030CCE3D0
MSLDQLLATMVDYGQLLLCNDQKLLWEVTLVIISIFAHILDARQNIWSRILSFPILFMSIRVYTIRKLYGKVIYAIISTIFHTYAYIKWKGGHQKPLHVSRTSNQVLVYTTAAGLLGALGWSFVIAKYSDAPPYAIYGDALYVSFGFIEKWFMSHKKLERWLIALLRYIAFSTACYSAGATMLGIQYLVLAFIGIYGQIKWYKSYQTTKGKCV